jgi:hypothetical protein
MRLNTISNEQDAYIENINSFNNINELEEQYNKLSIPKWENKEENASERPSSSSFRFDDTLTGSLNYGKTIILIMGGVGYEIGFIQNKDRIGVHLSFFVGIGGGLAESSGLSGVLSNTSLSGIDCSISEQSIYILPKIFVGKSDNSYSISIGRGAGYAHGQSFSCDFTIPQPQPEGLPWPQDKMIKWPKLDIYRK